MWVLWKSNTKKTCKLFSLYKIYINVKMDFDHFLIMQWITQLLR